MTSGAMRHLVRRVAGCILFFGLVAPPLGGMLMLLLMTFGISGYVDPGYFNVGDVLEMLVFIGAFSYALGFLPACLVGLSSESLIPAFADCGGFCCYARCYPLLLLVC